DVLVIHSLHQPRNVRNPTLHEDELQVREPHRQAVKDCAHDVPRERKRERENVHRKESVEGCEDPASLLTIDRIAVNYDWQTVALRGFIDRIPLVRASTLKRENRELDTHHSFFVCGIIDYLSCSFRILERSINHEVDFLVVRKVLR